MSIVDSIEDFLGIESLRSGELFSRFALLSKAEEWYYVRTHPAPPGVTSVQGPRKAWRWNASMARQAGVSEADIASHTKDKSAQALAEARPFADVVRAERTPVDSDPEDTFEDWETFIATHRRVTSEEESQIRAQQKAAGLGDGKVGGTIYPEPIAKVNKEGTIVSATTMDGQLVPVGDSQTEDGRILRKNCRFNTSVDAENQYQYEKANRPIFDRSGKNKLQTISVKSRIYAVTKEGRKAERLISLAVHLSDIRERVKQHLENPVNMGPMRATSVQESAFAIALIDHTFKRIGSSGGDSVITTDGREGRPLRIDRPKRQKVIDDYKKSKKFLKVTNNRIYTKYTSGANKGKHRDITPYKRIPLATYGITDCLPKHVQQDAKGNVSLVFPGKDGVMNNSPITDPFLAKELIRRKTELEKKGPKGEKTSIVGTSAGTVRDYLKHISPTMTPLTPHKFRAYHATRLAKDVIKSVGDPPKIGTQELNAEVKRLNATQVRRTGKGFSEEELRNITESSVKKLQLAMIVDQVGNKVAPNLGHSGAVCVDEYISDEVFEDSGWSKHFKKEQNYHMSKNLMATVRKPKKRKRRKRANK